MFSDGIKVYEKIDKHLANATGVEATNIKIVTLERNIDVADINFWDNHINGK